MTGASYEVQGYSGGRWQVLAVFDDKRLATIDVERLRSQGRHSALRLQSEVYDERRGHYVSQTIYRHSRLDPHNAKAVRERGAGRQRPDPARVLSRIGRPRPRAAAGAPGPDARLLGTSFSRLANILLIAIVVLLWIDWLKHLH